MNSYIDGSYNLNKFKVICQDNKSIQRTNGMESYSCNHIFIIASRVSSNNQKLQLVLKYNNLDSSTTTTTNSSHASKYRKLSTYHWYTINAWF